ncbi:MAG: cupin domain-containing protein [Bacteroidia bacterium]|nr:cupin domain-containing protein [Bacteroidia bacterium]
MTAVTEKAKRIIEFLGLEPLTMEGGFYKETYRSDETIEAGHLPTRFKSKRAFATAIYYLLTPDTFSALHQLPSDEIFHFYLGDPVEMLQLFEDGTGKIIQLGNDIEKGQIPQVVVPKYTWQGTRLVSGGQFALLGTTVAPGFEFEDFITPDKEALLKKYPHYATMIDHLMKPH